MNDKIQIRADDETIREKWRFLMNYKIQMRAVDETIWKKWGFVDELKRDYEQRGRKKQEGRREREEGEG